jgi:hypothetical protein
VSIKLIVQPAKFSVRQMSRISESENAPEPAPIRLILTLTEATSCQVRSLQISQNDLDSAFAQERQKLGWDAGVGHKDVDGAERQQVLDPTDVDHLSH